MSKASAAGNGRCERRNVLLVHPKFSDQSFWNYQETLRAVGRRYSNTPLGLATFAALLPTEYQVRIVDLNVEELTEDDLAWADVVGTGGMLPQQLGALEVIRRAKKRGCQVLVGGSDPTTSPGVYGEADVVVAGEAEGVREQIVAAIETRATGCVIRAQDFPDITTSPIPRFDLLKLDRYLHVGIQVTRGCPFRCEFCSVVEINGGRSRMKTPEQVLAELEALYQIGYRGHVDFVDDNFVGDKKRAKLLLERLIPWLEEHGQPFEFSSEVSLDLADDDRLLELMQQASFFAVFVGIETPNQEALKASNKKQNLGRDITESLLKIQRAGIFINGGFIIGFDAEVDSVTEPMVECIDSAAIPVCMVGLLYALPGTRLARRLAEEGRLEGVFDDLSQNAATSNVDQCSSGINFRTLRPKSEVLSDYREVMRRVYEPKAYFGRVKRLVRMMDRSKARFRPRPQQILRDLRSFVRISARAGWQDKHTRRLYWESLLDALLHNPLGAKTAVSMAALYLHFGPFARELDEQIGGRLAEARRSETAAG